MDTKQKLNADEVDEMDLTGFVLSPLKIFLSSLVILLSGGLFLILLSWRSDIKLNCLYKRAPLKTSVKVLLKNKFDQSFEEDIYIQKFDDEISIKYFKNQKISYIWKPEIQRFKKLSTIDEGMRLSEFHSLQTGLYDSIIENRFTTYGANIIKISVPPVLHLVIHEALNPFYMFQAYTVLLWSLQFYWKFAIIIALTSVISVTASVWETRKQNRNLRDTMKSESNVILLRNGAQMELSSLEMVPGDTVLLPTNNGGYMMECDAVLVEGSCVVNESMLTGESIPITKVALENDENLTFNYDLHRQNIVFCGTEVLQAKSNSSKYVKAIVIRTGFMTTKGELVRAILFPPPLDFAFYRDFLKSIYVFLFLGLIGMFYSFHMWTQNGGTMAECLLNSFDILTFVVPAILPAALTSNNAFAQKRLQRAGIYCLHSKHICLCGGIDIVAFDKTGTLTESDLNLAGVLESKNSELAETLTEASTLPNTSLLIHCMAVCHSLIRMDGELTGNPLDIKVFEGINWELIETSSTELNPNYGVLTSTLVTPKNKRLEIALLKTYPFDSSVQRMTVVSKKKNASDFEVFMKGAPEKVTSFCRADSIPSNFSTKYQWFTKQGFRVIATATKSLSLPWSHIDKMSRFELEENSVFLGLIIMQNLVKDETYGAIRELHDAEIETVMVTGDNILTAINVGRDCQMIKANQIIIRVEAEINTNSPSNLKVSYTLDENDTSVHHFENKSILRSLDRASYAFAVSGNTFALIRNNDKDLLDRIVQRGKIFARMLPEQKIHLIEVMKNLGRQVIMCGDGCNDCGALKTAHAGISLSMAEASVAAPFTSKHVNIGCVPYLIKEGRTTLVSAFACFKFGVAFCFTQLIAVLMVFYIGTEPSDNQYLIVDIGLAAVPIVMIGNCGPHISLVKQKPSRHLLSFLPLFSIISFLFFQTLFYVGIWFYVQSQLWFVPYEFQPGLYPPNPSYEQTNIFLLSASAAVIAAFIYSKGAPYRKPLYTNVIMLFWVSLSAISVLFMSLYRSDDFASQLNMKISPSLTYRSLLALTMIINGLFCYLWEIYFIDGFLFSVLLPWYKDKIRGPHLLFEKIEAELQSLDNWPPIQMTSTTEIQIVVDSEVSNPLPLSSSKSSIFDYKKNIKKKKRWSSSHEDEEITLLNSSPAHNISNTSISSSFLTRQEEVLESSLESKTLSFHQLSSSFLSHHKETLC